MPHKTLGTEEFVKRSKEIHGDKYDYSATVYKNQRTHVSVNCLKHGTFLVRPDSHIRNRGCPKCGNDMLTEDEFVRYAKDVHGDKYDYSLCHYEQKKGKVQIVCPKHGPFHQVAQKHLSGQNCPKCSRSPICGASKMTREQFVLESSKAHKDRCDYSLVQFNSIRDKVTIICKAHGPFQQEAHSHMKYKMGCPRCGFNVSLAGDNWLDSFNDPSIIREEILRINGRKFKVDGFNPNMKTIYEYFGSFWHGHPSRFNPNDRHPFLKTTYGELHKKVLDRISYFESNGYNVIYTWGH